jgi:hypothetical protein
MRLGEWFRYQASSHLEHEQDGPGASAGALSASSSIWNSVATIVAGRRDDMWCLRGVVRPNPTAPRRNLIRLWQPLLVRTLNLPIATRNRRSAFPRRTLSTARALELSIHDWRHFRARRAAFEQIQLRPRHGEQSALRTLTDRVRVQPWAGRCGSRRDSDQRG